MLLIQDCAGTGQLTTGGADPSYGAGSLVGLFANGLSCGSSNPILTVGQQVDHPTLGGMGWGTPFLLGATPSSPSVCSTCLRSVFLQLHEEKDHSLCPRRWVHCAGCCFLCPTRSSPLSQEEDLVSWGCAVPILPDRSASASPGQLPSRVAPLRACCHREAALLGYSSALRGSGDPPCLQEPSR